MPPSLSTSSHSPLLTVATTNGTTSANRRAAPHPPSPGARGSNSPNTAGPSSSARMPKPPSSSSRDEQVSPTRLRFMPQVDTPAGTVPRGYVPGARARFKPVPVHKKNNNPGAARQPNGKRLRNGERKETDTNLDMEAASSADGSVVAHDSEMEEDDPEQPGPSNRPIKMARKRLLIDKDSDGGSKKDKMVESTDTYTDEMGVEKSMVTVYYPEKRERVRWDYREKIIARDPEFCPSYADEEDYSGPLYARITEMPERTWYEGVQVPMDLDNLPKFTMAPHDLEWPDEIAHERNLDMTGDKMLISQHPDDVRYYDPAKHIPIEVPDQLIYQGDLVDIKYLEFLNERNQNDGNGEVSRYTFFRCMNWFEMDSYQTMHTELMNELHHQSSGDTEVKEDAPCGVCGYSEPDVEWNDSGEMVFCDGCNQCVHADCYCIGDLEGQFFCDPCKMSGAWDNELKCELCPVRGGVMKRARKREDAAPSTSKKAGKKGRASMASRDSEDDKKNLRWVHLSCALWVPDVAIGTLKNVDGFDVDDIDDNRRHHKCAVCDLRMGAPIQCSKSGCKTFYHVACAQRKRTAYFNVDVREEKGEHIMFYQSYCSKHAAEFTDKYDAPAEDARRTETEKKEERGRQFHEEYFMVHVEPDVIARQLRIPELVVYQIYEYWKCKKRTFKGAPLLFEPEFDVNVVDVKPVKEADDGTTTLSLHKDVATRLKTPFAREQWTVSHIFTSMQRALNGTYMVRARERRKREGILRDRQIFNQLFAMEDNSSVPVGASSRQTNQILQDYLYPTMSEQEIAESNMLADRPELMRKRKLPPIDELCKLIPDRRELVKPPDCYYIPAYPGADESDDDDQPLVPPLKRGRGRPTKAGRKSAPADQRAQSASPVRRPVATTSATIPKSAAPRVASPTRTANGAPAATKKSVAFAIRAEPRQPAAKTPRMSKSFAPPRRTSGTATTHTTPASRQQDHWPIFVRPGSGSTSSSTAANNRRSPAPGRTPTSSAATTPSFTSARRTMRVQNPPQTFSPHHSPVKKRPSHGAR